MSTAFQQLAEMPGGRWLGRTNQTYLRSLDFFPAASAGRL
ncbi:hypothetical protein Nizo2484_1623 [Lactiplantibacillus plantarum]|nr:hypothetical protein Nizo2484_1623 [Lactiplantibacillus plantarum]KZU28396.1 hypothetical protein Nizo2485_0932 [Lactiplantibacillus plantarum]